MTLERAKNKAAAEPRFGEGGSEQQRLVVSKKRLVVALERA